jgi:tetratricopeptide (TPR) repeat protein
VHAIKAGDSGRAVGGSGPGVLSYSGYENFDAHCGRGKMPDSHVLYDEADKLKDAGKLEEAAEKLNELLKADPNYALAHSALAVIYTRLKQHDAAIVHGLKVCELEPNDAFSFTAMSVTFQRAGKILEAEDAMARARMLQMGH